MSKKFVFCNQGLFLVNPIHGRFDVRSRVDDKIAPDPKIRTNGTMNVIFSMDIVLPTYCQKIYGLLAWSEKNWLTSAFFQ